MVGAAQSTGWVIHSLTLVSDAAAPVALKRTRSRSVRMPIGRWPSTITTDPFFCSAIRFDTSATVSDEWAVIAGELITSATVRTVLVAGMPWILPSRPPRRARDGRADQTTFTCPRHAAHASEAQASHRGATVSDVNPLTTFVRSLGNDGALANAQAVLDARDREDWIVQGLTQRLERSAPAAAAVPGAA